MRNLLATLLLLLTATIAVAQEQLANLVCFVRFADETEDAFIHDAAFYEDIYNNLGTGRNERGIAVDAQGEEINSVASYFQWASYGRLHWLSHFFPATAAEAPNVLSYQDINPRGWLRPYSESNPRGYRSYSASVERERELVERVAAYVNGLLPDGIKLDNISEGVVDNLTLVISGNSEQSSSVGIMWPHNDILRLSEARIKGCRLRNYLVVFDNANGWKTGKPKELYTAVLCHEMMHTLNAYDLYTSDSKTAVSQWDLMSDHGTMPQGLTAYTRMKYGKWIDVLPGATQDGTYTLSPVGGATSDNVALKIAPAANASEYFVVEYRKRDGIFESQLPASGLICYRVNESGRGNLATPYEVYVFRPGGKPASNGNIKNAALSAEMGMTSLNTTGSLSAIYYSDGTTAPFYIGNVGEAGETISFDLHFDNTPVTAIAGNRMATQRYNLMGQPVGRGYRGVVISNGKKIIQQ